MWADENLPISDKTTTRDKERQGDFVMSDEKCPGKSKKGNPCKNKRNPDDPEGYCGTCRKRVQREEKSKRKEKKRQAKQAEQIVESSLDYDPEQLLKCQAHPECENDVLVGHEETDSCAKAFSLYRVISLVHRTHKKRDALEEKQHEYLRRLHAKLDSLKEGGGPFPVCSECQFKLASFLERTDLFIDYTRAMRGYRERIAEEERRQEKAEAKSKEEAKKAKEREEKRKAREQELREKKAQEADDFLAAFGDEDVSEEPEQKNTSQYEKSVQFMHKMSSGEMTDQELGREFLHQVESDEIKSCCNPNCQEHGTMTDPASRDDGSIIMTMRTVYDKGEPVGHEEVPLLKMWSTHVKMLITYKQGPDKGKVVIQDDGSELVKYGAVILCSRCGNIYREVVEGAQTRPLKAAVNHAVKQHRRIQGERFGKKGNGGNGNPNSGPRRGRGPGGMQAQSHDSHDHGMADPEDLDRFVSNGDKKGLVKMSEAVGDHLVH